MPPDAASLRRLTLIRNYRYAGMSSILSGIGPRILFSPDAVLWVESNAILSRPLPYAALADGSASTE